MPQRDPIKVYRLWCGRKRYTPWLPDLESVWAEAFRHGLAFPGINGGLGGLGPLTWIEKGERSYEGRKTISLGRG